MDFKFSALSSFQISIFFIFLLAGFIKGVIGLGLPTVSIGLLSLLMSPIQAASLLVAPSFLTNIWQLAGRQLLPLIRRIWPMLVWICIGTWIGGLLLDETSISQATLILGLALAFYSILGLGNVRLSVGGRAEIWLSPIIGALTGVITAATGIFVIPAVPYLQALNFEKEDLIQVLGISFMVSTLALAANLSFKGALTASLSDMTGLALAPALIGMLIGQYLRSFIPPTPFRYCFFLGLLCLSIHIVLRGFIS